MTDEVTRLRAALESIVDAAGDIKDMAACFIGAGGDVKGLRNYAGNIVSIARAALATPSAPAPGHEGEPPTGVGDSGKEPIPSHAKVVQLPLMRLSVVTFFDGERWAAEVHGYTDDVDGGQRTRIRTRGWFALEPTADELHGLVTTWFDHELREQLKMSPHAPMTDKPVPPPAVGPTAIDALEYIASWCRSHRKLTFYAESYLAAFDDIRDHAEAAIERLKRGDRLESTSTLMTAASPPASPVAETTGAPAFDHTTRAYNCPQCGYHMTTNEDARMLERERDQLRADLARVTAERDHNLLVGGDITCLETDNPGCGVCTLCIGAALDVVRMDLDAARARLAEVEAAAGAAPTTRGDADD